jgi:hypothetical protein
MNCSQGIHVYSLIELRRRHAIRDGENGPGCVAALILVHSFIPLFFPTKSQPFSL